MSGKLLSCLVGRLVCTGSRVEEPDIPSPPIPGKPAPPAPHGTESTGFGTGPAMGILPVHRAPEGVSLQIL